MNTANPDSEAMKKEQRALIEAASNPDATGDELYEIYLKARRHWSATSRKVIQETPEAMAAIARHPNTPPKTLALLVQGFPEAVLENPILPFIPLEAPTFWAEIPGGILQDFLRYSQVPVSALKAIASGGATNAHERVRRDAAHHIGLAGELDPTAWQDAVRTVCKQEGVRSKNEATQWFADWIETGLLPTEWSGDAPLPAPAPAYEPRLNVNRPSFVRAKDKLAILPADAAPDYLHGLVQDKTLMDAPIVLAVALHPNTSAETLRYLGQRREMNLGLAVVQHPNTPPDTLHHFTEGVYEGYVARCVLVARHPSASVNTIRDLAAHGNPVVRRLARRHKNAPDGLVEISRQTNLVPGKTPISVKDHAPLWYVIHALHAVRPTTKWIEKCAASSDWILRLAAALALLRRASESAAPKKSAAQTKALETALREKLQNDGNRFVRAVARADGEAFDFAL